jgi:hypothetical protein
MYLKLTFYTPQQKAGIARGAILGAFAEHAAPMNLESIPRFGIGASTPQGPWQIYTVAADARSFAEKHKEIKLTVEAVEHLLKVTLVSAMEEEADYFDSAGGKPAPLPFATVVLYLDSHAKFRHTKHAALKDAFKSMSAICFKSNHQLVKVGETSIEGCHTERMYCKIRPLSGGFGSIKWARTADVKASYFNHRVKVERILSIQYSIVEDNNFTDETFCLRQCHTKRPCDCPQRGKHKAEHAGNPAKKNSRSAVGIFMHASNDMCKHFESGLCVQAVANGRCYYKHPDTPLASEVDCKLPRSKFGKRTCRNGAKCLYRHNFEMDVEDATLSQLVSDDLCARDRSAWDTRVRRGTHAFDSTLGFPGEGPAKAISWNARGLNPRT